MGKITPFLWYDTEAEEAADALHVGLPQLEDRRRHPLRLRRAAGPRAR